MIASSGPISLANVQAEFGGSTPTSLTEYYAGGPYVPSGTSGVNGAVPSSGAISLSHFYGTSASVSVTVNFTDQAVESYVGSGGSGNSRYQITSTGAAQGDANAGSYTLLEQGIVPATTGYEVFVTRTGAAGLGPTGAWTALPATWGVGRAHSGVSSANLTFQIRKVGTTTVLDTWNVHLFVEVEI